MKKAALRAYIRELERQLQDRMVVVRVRLFDPQGRLLTNHLVSSNEFLDYIPLYDGTPTLEVARLTVEPR